MFKGKRLQDVVLGNEENAATFVKYSRGFQTLSSMITKPKHRENIKVTVLFGTPGSGKTYHAMGCDDPNISVFKKSVGEHWYDGYHGEKRLVLDEYNGYLPWSLLLSCLDVYKLTTQVKGGFVAAEWEEVFITCNIFPTNWYPTNSNFQWNALERRVHSWGLFTLEDGLQSEGPQERIQKFFNNWRDFKKEASLVWENMQDQSK
jgi:hypothetical protein